MNIKVFRHGLPIAEIDGILRDSNIVDGRLVWQRFPDDIASVLAEYSSALEDLSFHDWDAFRETIQAFDLEARGEMINGQVEDLQVYENGASLVKIKGK